MTKRLLPALLEQAGTFSALPLLRLRFLFSLFSKRASEFGKSTTLNKAIIKMIKNTTDNE